MRGALVLLALTASAHAQGLPNARKVYEAAANARVDAIEKEDANRFATAKIGRDSDFASAYAEEQRDVERVTAGARTLALDVTNSTSLPQVLALAVKTDVKGAEAGVVVAPLVALGHTGRLARGLSLTLAALKDDKFRAGAAFSFPLVARPRGPAALKLEVCTFDKGDFRTRLLAATDGYERVCMKVQQTPYPGDAAPTAEAWIRATVACGLEPPADVAAATVGGRPAAARIAAMRGAGYTPRVAAVVQFMEQVAKVAPLDGELSHDVSTLRGLRMRPTLWACYSDAQIAAAAYNAAWTHSETVLGLSARADFFALQYGFQPDASKPLQQGELSDSDVRAEVRHTINRLSFAAGVGVGMSRDSISEQLVKTIRPAFGFQYVVARHRHYSLASPLAAAPKDTSLPPHILLGLDAAVGYAFSKPSSQESAIDDVRLTVFADFRVNSTIAFRVGVPIEADTITRKADPSKTPPIEEKRARQWTVPVFLSTVLQL